MIGKAPVTPFIEILSTAGVRQCRATAKSRKRRLGPSVINWGLRGQENEGANHARAV